MESAVVGAAIHAACLAELEALKPGNVHRYAPGHGMTLADFEASAAALGRVFAEPGLTVGERIERSIAETAKVVSCNTNLGIVLLCAPLAEAALMDDGRDLRGRLAAVLRDLTIADADLAFRAIRLAAPAGLSTVTRHDVHAPAHVDLRAAMAEAQERDTIAKQYASDFADVFEFGVPRYRADLARWSSESWATTAVYLGFLARLPDSHVVRKYGSAPAEALRRRAVEPDADLRVAVDPTALQGDLLRLDAMLKDEGLNPGTSADLTVATLFAARLEDGLDADA